MFTLNKQFLPYNAGTQIKNNGQMGGPQGFMFGTAQVKPWPYATRFINPFYQLPYGTAASNALAQPWPYATGVQIAQMIGVAKQATAAYVA